MNRRTVLTTGLGLAATGLTALWAGRGARAHADKVAADAPAQTTEMLATPEDWRALTEADWRARLSPAAFAVLRKEGTERPFTSPLNGEKRAGVFHCAGCDLPLFDAAAKYDSGTGWPSFSDYLPDALGFKRDNKLWTPRTEYHCARCGGHQGHVFEDGPKPTGLRYCNNGVALTFHSADPAA